MMQKDNNLEKVKYPASTVILDLTAREKYISQVAEIVLREK
jgi:hypothetical protein